MTQIQLRRDTSTNWSSVNPVLASGEPAFETDTGKFKIGNGTTAYNSLDYIGAGDLPDNITTQGNTFNGASQLVQLDSTGKLPAIDGSQLTNISSSTPSNMMTTNTNQTISGDKTFSAHDIILYATDASTLAKIRGRYGTGTIDIIIPTGSSHGGPCFGNTSRETRLESSSIGIEIYADKDASATSGMVDKLIHTGNMLGCITAGDNISITSTGSGKNRQMVISSTGGEVPTNIVTTSDSTPLVIWKGTQSAYDGITTKDANTLYIITGA